MLVLLSALMAPLFGGAVIYYVLRGSHPELARLGNLTSFSSFGGLILLYFFVPFIFGFVKPLLSLASLAGLGLAVYTVVKAKEQAKQ